MIHYVTPVDLSYLHRWLTLYESVLAHCRPAATWVVAMTPRVEAAFERLAIPGIGVVSFAEIETPELRALKPSIPWNQYIWASKPTIMLHLYRTQPAVKTLIWLDGDCFFFSSPHAIYSALQSEGTWLGLTPHRFMGAYTRYAINGYYNGGFIYTTRRPFAFQCLHAWQTVCTEPNDKRHRHIEQRHLETWPERWGATVISHKGLNLAPWNQNEEQYRYELRDNRLWVDEDPIVMYHFHEGLGTRYPLDPFVKNHLYRAYKAALARAGEIYADYL